MSRYQGEQISVLVSAISAIAVETWAGFGDLTAQQLNWKPSAEQWSVAQCFDHLVTANAAYFPTFDQVLSGDKKNTFWESLPWLPSVWGRLLIKAVSPESKRKLKAPKLIRPSTSSIDRAVIRRFVAQQDQVIQYMRATEGLDLERIHVTSPIMNLITYSLLDAYRIIVNHEKRHFLQARRVLETAGFPKE